MIAPFFYICLFYIIGILLNYYFYWYSNYLSFYLASYIILAIICYRKSLYKLCLISLSLAIILLGLFIHSSYLEAYKTKSIYKILYIDKELPLNESIYTEFELIDEPSETESKIYFIAEIKRIKYSDKVFNINGNVRLSLIKSKNNQHLDYHYSDILSAYVLYHFPFSFKNEGSFDYGKYLYANNIHAVGNIKNLWLLKKINVNQYKKKIRKLYEFKNYIDIIIMKYFAEKGKINQEVAFMEALLIGKRENLSEEMKDLMQKSGLFHLIAISGFNLSIILYFFYFILNKVIGMSRKASNLSLLIIIPAFIILSSASASVLRTSMMSFLFILALILFQPIQLLNIIGISALIILLIRPNQLFDVGFQLTFLVTISLIILGDKIRCLFPKRFNFLWLNLSFSIASLIATFFHNIFLFHKISFISLILNIIAVPLFSAMLILGFSFIIIPLYCFRYYFACTIKMMLSFFFYIIKETSNIPYAYILIGKKSYLLSFVIFFIIVEFFHLKSIKKRVAAILLLIFLIAGNTFIYKKASNKLEIIMFDVGHGDSIFIRFPNNKKLLIDGGGSVLSNFDIGKNVVSAALLADGTTNIDYVLLTHEHPDHINGLYYILQEFKVKEFWDANCSYKKPICVRILNLINKKRIKILQPHTGYSMKIGDATITFLYSPDYYRFNKINNNSIVLKIEAYGRIILLTGDIEKENESLLMKNYQKKLKSHIIKVPHHGSNTSNTDCFLDKVNAKIALLSVGRNNFYNLPSPQVIQKYLQRKYALYRTDQNGEIKIEISPTGLINIETYL